MSSDKAGSELSPKTQVIGLGQACVDYLGRLDSYPPENGKAELAELHTQCGGPASTAMLTLARLGVQTAFLGSLSDDAFGVKILKNLQNNGVDVSALKITPGYTSQFAFIAITGKGLKRTIYWRRGSVPHLKANQVDLLRFPQAEILHTDGLMIEASIEAARQAKQRGMTVVLDAGTMRKGSKELASLVDVLIASETFAAPLIGKAADPRTALYALQELGPGQVVVTLGAEGSIGLNQKETFYQEAFDVHPIDTTGAGDVYHGAYIFGLLQKWSMPRCMRFASAAAALKCRKVGAQAGIPDLDSINLLIPAD